MNQVSLLSSVKILRSDLLNFLLQVGVQYTKNSPHLSDYVLHTGNATVWIELDSIEPRYPNPEVDALIEQKLGGLPRTHILLHLSSNPESEQLALVFASQLAEHWPFVLDNLSGRARRIFTRDELQSLHNRGLGLWEDEKLVSRPKDEDPFAKFTFIPRWMQDEYTSQGKPLPDWMTEQLKLQGFLGNETQANDGDYLKQVQDLLDQGLEMEAIKLYRQYTKVSLREAKKAVDRLKDG